MAGQSFLTTSIILTIMNKDKKKWATTLIQIKGSTGNNNPDGKNKFEPSKKQTPKSPSSALFGEKKSTEKTFLLNKEDKELKLVKENLKIKIDSVNALISNGLDTSISLNKELSNLKNKLSENKKKQQQLFELQIESDTHKSLLESYKQVVDNISAEPLSITDKQDNLKICSSISLGITEVLTSLEIEIKFSIEKLKTMKQNIKEDIL
jgi:hypothetical protein